MNSSNAAPSCQTDVQEMEILDENISKSQSGKHAGRCFSGLGNGTVARHLVNGKNYKMVFKATAEGSNVVKVLDKTMKVKGKFEPVFRIDGPHAGTKYNYNHININKKISGKAYDPHLKIGEGSASLSATRNTMKAMKWLNRGIIALSVATDAVRTGVNIRKDVKAKTSRNTVECVANIAGGWSGGAAGAAGGAAIGSAIFPGVGTIIGGIVGGITGGVGGSVAASSVVDKVGG